MDKLIELARTVPNKGKMHIFLGDPLSDGSDKTTVEPGNNFSPGVWTCGVSVWVKYDEKLYSPDVLLDDEINWEFHGEHNAPPVVISEYKIGIDFEIKNYLTHLGSEGTEGVDFCRLEMHASADKEAFVYIVARDIGPAGAKIESIAWDGKRRELLINKGLRLVVETPCECGILPSDERFDSPMAVISCPVIIKAKEITEISFKTIHSAGNQVFGQAIPRMEQYTEFSVAEGFAQSISRWNNAFTAKVFAPDCRINKKWEQCIFHILSAMECGLPRIGAVNYPVFWLRDGVIILRALDLIGRHDLARIGNDYLASLYFGGGFGAESDAPGEGIWALVSHGIITKDIKWLESIFFHIQKRVEYILQMLSATTVIRRPAEGRIPFYVDQAGINILCLPSINGTINGRMDWHSPNFFINCWSAGGLKYAAEAAALLGKFDLSDKWKAAANRLEEAIAKHLLPVYGNERDPIITPYPSGTLSEYKNSLKDKFKDWYMKNRLTPDCRRIPENLWTYFEAAQIHNAVLLGLKDSAWINLDGMLEANGSWDVSAYPEGRSDGNENLPFGNGENRRGWLSDSAFGGNMPHNWTSAEMVNLIRDIFIVEEGDCLVLGKGVPAAWLQPGCTFGIKDMPTNLGVVSYSVTVDEKGAVFMDYCGPKKYKVDFFDTVTVNLK